MNEVRNVAGDNAGDASMTMPPYCGDERDIAQLFGSQDPQTSGCAFRDRSRYEEGARSPRPVRVAYGHHGRLRGAVERLGASNQPPMPRHVQART